MRRRLWLLPVALIVLAIGAHALFWRWAEQRLTAGYAAWAAERRAAGWAVQAGPPVGGGWPLAATLAIPNLSMQGGESDMPGGFSWSAERTVLRVALLRPRALSIVAEGAQRLRVAESPEIPYTADRLEAVVPLGPRPAPPSADILASNIRAGMPSGRETAGSLTVGLLQAHLELRPSAPQGEPALAFAISAEGIGLPPGTRWPLGGRISSVSVDGALDGPVPRRAGWAERAIAWRDGGGTLAIEHLAVGWGPLGLSASATLALDEQLQPMGTANTRLVGYAESLDALAANGVITRRADTAAKAVLALIARAPENGDPAQVEVPLTLQDRTLSVRQIPLTRLPKLAWPAK
jgi:hypothetical protein